MKYTDIKLQVPTGADVEIIINGEKKKLSELTQDEFLFNYKTDRRWITAQTFRMLNSYGGWDAAYRTHGYMWQFEFVAQQLERMIKLQDKNPELLEKEMIFFNGRVIGALCNHYIKKLVEYKDKHKEPVYKYNEWNGHQYEFDFKLKTSRWGVIDKREFINKVTYFSGLAVSITSSNNLEFIESVFHKFVRDMNKIPHDTVMCPELHDAYKGIGAYESLKNMIKYHDCVLPGYSRLNKTDSLKVLDEILDGFSKEVWRLHILLKETIKYNNFNLYESESYKIQVEKKRQKYYENHPLDMSFYNGTLNKSVAKEVILRTSKPLYLREGLRYRGAKARLIDKSKAIKVIVEEGFLDIQEDADGIVLNTYSANDMY